LTLFFHPLLYVELSAWVIRYSSISG
jgi:hypothetical protein